MEEHEAVERIVRGAFGALTGRRGEALRYAMMDDTPVGVLGLAAGARGLRHLSFVRGEDDFLERLLAEHGDAQILKSAELDEVRRALGRYFGGKRFDFDLAVDLGDLAPFHRRVLDATAKVPAGRVATYTQIAARAGSPKASRAPATPFTTTPSPSSSPATESCAPTAPWAATAAGSRSRNGSSGTRARCCSN